MDRTDVAPAVDATAPVSDPSSDVAEVVGAVSDAPSDELSTSGESTEVVLDPSDGVILNGLIDRAALVGRDPTGGVDRVPVLAGDADSAAGAPGDGQADAEPEIVLIAEAAAADPEPTARPGEEATSPTGVSRPRSRKTATPPPPAPPPTPAVSPAGPAVSPAGPTVSPAGPTVSPAAAIPEVPVARRRAAPIPVPRWARRPGQPTAESPVFVDPDSTSEIMKRPQRPPRPLQQPIAVRKVARPTVRRVSRTLRHVDPWSVFKVAVVFNLFMMITTLTAGVFLWQVAVRTGTIDNVERGFENVGWEVVDLKSKGGEIFHNAWMIGLFVVVGLTGLAVLMATLFNLITDLMGGIRLTILEEDLQPRAERFANIGQPGGAPGPAQQQPAKRRWFGRAG